LDFTRADEQRPRNLVDKALTVLQRQRRRRRRGSANEEATGEENGTEPQRGNIHTAADWVDAAPRPRARMRPRAMAHSVSPSTSWSDHGVPAAHGENAGRIKRRGLATSAG